MATGRATDVGRGEDTSTVRTLIELIFLNSRFRAYPLIEIRQAFPCRATETGRATDTGICEQNTPFTRAIALRRGSRDCSPAPDLVFLEMMSMGLLLRRSVFVLRHRSETRGADRSWAHAWGSTFLLGVTPSCYLALLLSDIASMVVVIIVCMIVIMIRIRTVSCQNVMFVFAA